MKPQIDRQSYFSKEYNTKARFCSYWHQIDEVLRLNPDSVLEIGLGNGFVPSYLRSRNMNVVTADFDRSLGSDIVGNVTHLPFNAKSFDVVTCFEVLEHIPYDFFLDALCEMHRVCLDSAVLSLPDSTRRIRVALRAHDILDFHANFRFPRIRKSVHEFDGQHYWEIGRHTYPLGRILRDFKSAGFIVRKTYYIPENPRHRFFVLSRR